MGDPRSDHGSARAQLVDSGAPDNLETSATSAANTVLSVSMTLAGILFAILVAIILPGVEKWKGYPLEQLYIILKYVVAGTIILGGLVALRSFYVVSSRRHPVWDGLFYLMLIVTALALPFLTLIMPLIAVWI